MISICMAIEHRPNRAKPYRVYWRNPYTQKQHCVSFATEKEAKEHDSLVKHKLKFDRESFRPFPVEEAKQGGTLVHEIVALYLGSRPITSRSNLRETLLHLKSVIAMFGDREVSTLTKQDIMHYMQQETQAGRKPSTAHRRLAILRAAIEWAHTQGVVESNPLLGIKVPKGKPERFVPPSYNEFAAILAVAPPHMRRALLLSVSLGVRVGETELLSLRWADTDLARGIIRVWSSAKNPNRPYRDVPIRVDLLEEMQKWEKEDLVKYSKTLPETIVHYKGKKVKAIKTSWKHCKEKAGITRRLRLYDLRHAYATFALNAGADINAVAANMGHSDPAMILRHYQFVSEEIKRQAVEALPSFIQ